MQPDDEGDPMRMAAAAALLALTGGTSAAQVLHPGEVEHWLLALAPLHEARACIVQDDPLRPGLELLLRDTQARAMQAIRGDYAKGVLAGRLMALTVAAPSPGAEDAACQRILASVARGLLRLHVP